MNMTQLIVKIIQEKDLYNKLINKYPSLSDYQAADACFKYLTACLNEYHSSNRGKLMSYVNQTRLRNKAGRVKIHGKKQYIYYLFKSIAPFFIIEKTGNSYSNTLSAGVVNPEFKKYLGEFNQMKQEIFNTDESIIQLPVYIDKDRAWNVLTTAKSDDDVYVKLKSIVERIKDDRLIENYQRKQTGRYYSVDGYGLQNLKKEYRRKLLGYHVELDMRAACYNVIYALWRTVCREFDLSGQAIDVQLYWIPQYLENSDGVRRKVARDLLRAYYKDVGKHAPVPKLSNTSDYYKCVKQAFTAIGFGARTNNPNSIWYNRGKAVKPSLTAIFKSNRMAENFLENEFVSGFLSELEYVLKFIHIAFFAKDPEEPIDGDEFRVNLSEARGQGQTLAWAYQAIESELLDILYGVVNDHAGPESVWVLLHDGLSVAPTAVDVINDIKYDFQRHLNNYEFTARDGTKYKLFDSNRLNYFEITSSIIESDK